MVIKRDGEQEREPESLSEVRERARGRLKGICGVYKVCDGRDDRLCQGQKYGDPIGLGGVGKGLSFRANVEALDLVRLRTRLISDHREPDMNIGIYGAKSTLPVMPSSVSGVKASMGGTVTEMEFAVSVLSGAADTGVLGWIGNTSDEGEELTGIKAVERVGRGILIFKPQRNNRLLELISMAENAGAVAVGVDLDGVGSTNWERHGRPVFRKSPGEIEELAGSTDLPFIVKGIMSVDDALLAVDSGVQGIDVSNHGGRALDCTRGVADVLPEIVEAVKGRVTVTAGGGVRTGFDVIKMLALGADGVLIGRDIVRAAIGGGAKGVRLHFEYLRSEIRRGMILTDCSSVSEIGPGILER